jgi:sec-independent protein translocase protein TatA
MELNTVFLSLPGGSEWILIVLVIVLLFGGKKIPELMKGLGEGIKEFKKAKDGDHQESAKSDTNKDLPKN